MGSGITPTLDDGDGGDDGGLVLVAPQVILLWHYDNLPSRVLSEGMAGEDDETDSTSVWVCFSVISSVIALSSFLVWVAILVSPKTRRSPFNWYVLFLLLPDWSSAVGNTFVYIINAAEDSKYNSPILCGLAVFDAFWVITSNAWINAFIAADLYYMIRCSHCCLRYQPPTIRSVTKKCLAAYIWATLMSAWAAFAVPWFPSEPSADRYYYCNGLDFSLRGLLFWWLLYMPCIFLLPCLYICWVRYWVWRKKWLPLKGQRRRLYLYFSRIFFVYIISWIPAVLVYGAVRHPEEMITYVVNNLSRLQVVFSALVALWKPDVWAAFKSLWERITCGICVCRRKKKENKRRSRRYETPSSSCFTEGVSSSLKVPPGLEASFRQFHGVDLEDERRNSVMIQPPDAKALSGEDQQKIDCRSPTPVMQNVDAPGSRRHSHSSAPRSEKTSTCSMDTIEEYEDVPKQSDIHYQFNDELDENDPNSIIFHSIQEERDESHLEVAPF